MTRSLVEVGNAVDRIELAGGGWFFLDFAKMVDGFEELLGSADDQFVSLTADQLPSFSLIDLKGGSDTLEVTDGAAGWDTLRG